MRDTHLSDGTHRPTRDRNPDSAAASGVSFGGLPNGVRFELDPARDFITNAVREYDRCLDSRDADGVPSHLPRASGLLFGVVDSAEIVIREVEFVANVRDRDEGVIAEFETNIAARFGDVYRNPGRGFWCDESSVLRAVQRHSTDGLDLLGSVHSHPNWHEIGPPWERSQKLSENPTQMDDYLFRQSGWPVNIIWYVHTCDGTVAHRVAGWRAGLEDCTRLDLSIPATFCSDHTVETVA